MQIAERCNVTESGAGYVTAFDVDAEYVANFGVQQIGGREHLELWVPAAELAASISTSLASSALSARLRGDEAL